ncbi:MAG: metallophosphoesterase family protein [Candidatus Nitrosocaldus sp.]|nr:metallophosphoesterase family protein [Candidatus Nitrosocaldus sp.]MDW8000504.1 metallophosphoesterase family protein [Candidatus Nitrosocaldus sp.]
MLRMVKDHPLLVVEYGNYGGSEGSAGRKRYLVASDLHIGFEYEFATRGVRIDDGYVHEMLNELISIARRERCDGMILLGDIKSSIRGISREEWRSIPAFMDGLMGHVDELYIVPGNHDSHIARLLPERARVMRSRGMVMDDTLFIHGHTLPDMEQVMGMGVRRVVMGHMHPTLAVRDSILSGERVWLILKTIYQRNHYDYDHYCDHDTAASHGHGHVMHGSSSSSSSSKRTVTDGLSIIVMPTLNRHIASLHRSYSRGRTLAPLLRWLTGSGHTVRAMVLTLDGSLVMDGGLDEAMGMIYVMP